MQRCGNKSWDQIHALQTVLPKMNALFSVQSLCWKAYKAPFYLSFRWQYQLLIIREVIDWKHTSSTEWDHFHTSVWAEVNFRSPHINIYSNVPSVFRRQMSRSCIRSPVSSCTQRRPTWPDSTCWTRWATFCFWPHRKSWYLVLLCWPSVFVMFWFFAVNNSVKMGGIVCCYVSVNIYRFIRKMYDIYGLSYIVCHVDDHELNITGNLYYIIYVYCE